MNTLHDCLKWVFTVESWRSFVRYPDGRTVQMMLKGALYDFCADPFLFRKDGVNWLFYEREGRRRKGEIGCLMEKNGTWMDEGTVLELPVHLSYPQVFEDHGRVFMIPESYDFFRGNVDLYEATDFPRGWKKVKTLIAEPSVDSTILLKDGCAYLICTFVGEHPRADLRVASSLFGDWTLHPQAVNLGQSARVRRSAGRFFEERGRLYRVVQDCDGEYGKCVYRIPVLTLTPTDYREGDPEMLLPGGHTYNTLETPDGLMVAFDKKFRERRSLGESIRLAFEMLGRKLVGK